MSLKQLLSFRADVSHEFLNILHSAFPIGHTPFAKEAVEQSEAEDFIL